MIKSKDTRKHKYYKLICIGSCMLLSEILEDDLLSLEELDILEAVKEMVFKNRKALIQSKIKENKNSIAHIKRFKMKRD